MTGGLIQIITYGSQDLYLTGTPEITYFKSVYRRHTNFASESVILDFADNIGFGKEALITFPKVGDLLHKLYVEITLPEIDIKRSNFINDFEQDYIDAQTNYNAIRDYMVLNILVYHQATNLTFLENVSTTSTMITYINDEFGGTGTIISLTVDEITAITDAITNVIGGYDLLFHSIKGAVMISEQLLLGNTVELTDTYADYVAITELNDATLTKALTDLQGIAIIKEAYNKSETLLKTYFDIMIEKKKIHEEASNQNLKFAWVERVGHAIIDRVEIEIGGQVIERQYGEWLNIWYELTGNKDNDDGYNKMIGNVPSLTTFDRTVKPEYKLYIPLQFWFCKHNGLSIPLVALQYHDVALRLKLRKLEECAYMEEGQLIAVPEFVDQLYLNEIVDDLGKEVTVRIFADYIYLESQERKRFSQASHEYMIEQLQIDEFRDVRFQRNKYLLDFQHPCKFIAWVVQKQSYRENSDGYNQCRWDNYSLNDDNTDNIVTNSYVTLHGLDVARRKSGSYYNYVQPYQYFKNVPSDGLNVYSFCLNPMEYQPSGSLNFSRMNKAFLNLELDGSLFPVDQEPEHLTMRTYTVNFNIIRIISGMAGCAYTCVM
jgi:hypothetical protein